MTELCGYTDRYFADKGWWRRWCTKPAGHAGESHFDPINPAAPEPEPGTEAEEVDEFVVTVAGHEVELADLAGSPARYFKWVSANRGWSIKAQVSETYHQAVRYAATGKLGRKGDVRVPARTQIHTTVRGIMSAEARRVAEFTATWVTISGKTTFVGVNTWDMFTHFIYPEKQTGVFDEWLRTLAPVDAPKPRKAKPEKEYPLLDQEEWSQK